MKGASEQMQKANIMLMAIATIIILAGMKAAGDIVILGMLAVFIAIILAKPHTSMIQRGVPAWVSISVITVAILGVKSIIFAIVARAATDFIANAPSYQSQLLGTLDQVLTSLKSIGLPLSKETLLSATQTDQALSIVSDTLKGLGSIASQLALTIIVALFLTAEIVKIPQRLELLVREETIERIQAFMISVRFYMAAKTMTSLVTGLAVWGAMIALDIQHAALWGAMAFVLNFIPSIGSMIAAIPPVLIALSTSGMMLSVIVAGALITINLVIGGIFEPKVLGKHAGLSPAMVILSLVFWGWMFGPTGMLLAVPLTQLMKKITVSLYSKQKNI